ncbi:TIR domain-containing protein [Candidatus Thiosymbion oneisti]|uniref:TIR domain-containing protein n=1 Tax=Candidatus Thiosymbion oneisti TaxID=589554 RepID=UPI000B2AFCCA|nr:TIR domain-containing protein [Candidatus Thiosymbion oneisti]
MPSFHVFLSHNNKDRSAIRALKRALAERGLKCWLDEEQLRPGSPWQDLLAQGIKDSGSVAVCVAADGLGPWEDEEMQSALHLAVKDCHPIIPVLLPGAPAAPELPLFLGNCTWVDLREGLNPEGIATLIWGIMAPRIVNLTIGGFRSFRELKLEGLGRVNLITGRNNTGKSSLLEAVRILASDFPPATIQDILIKREENVFDTDEPSKQGYPEVALRILTLFHGFPELSETWKPIVMAASGSQQPMKLTLTLSWFSEERTENGTRKYVPRQVGLFDEEDNIPALVFDTGDAERVLPLGNLRRGFYSPRPPRPEYGRLRSTPCIYVSPYGGESTEQLGVLWDRIALSDLEGQVVEALHIIDPSISAVSMVGGDRPRRSRTAIVRSGKIQRPVPLWSFGDGLNRLFGIALSLVNAKNGLLLIDEFENGMHYSVQLDTWRMIFRLAAALGVQVFATSHSWDAIEAFQKAAAETAEEGVLVRLARKGEDIMPTVFREDELRIATRDGIEVR